MGFSVSAATKEEIEEEVRAFIQGGYEKAHEIISQNNVEFERLAQGLLEYETLTGDEIKKIMQGEQLTQDDDDIDPGDKPTTPNAPVTSIPKTGSKRKKSKPSTDPEPDLA